MGSFANTLFRIMLSWLQGIASALWSAFTSEKGGSFLEWIGNHWIPIAIILCCIGLAADLSVYIVRWKPFRVWRSFFNRRKQRDTLSSVSPESDGKEESAPAGITEKVPAAVYSRQESSGFRADPDLSRWEKRENKQDAGETTKILPQVTVTNAGYTVPADSPYRRPADTAAGKKNVSIPEQETETEPAAEPEESYIPATMRSRRRRLNVSDLFSNPEEELYDFEAPQQLIDSRKAYHDPVYPRGWKKSEDSAK